MTKHINNTEWDAPYFIGDLSDFMIEIYYGYSIKGRFSGVTKKAHFSILILRNGLFNIVIS